MAPDMNYFVLIVLTDGDIVNEKRVVQELKKMQEYPISVFFIGIGTSKSFDFWRELPNATALDFDRDFEKTKKDTVMSKKAVRRVARFVKFSEYEDDPEGLVKATLAELPQEIVMYYRMLGVKPRGLERFENKYGESHPVSLPRVAKGEFGLAQQRTADRTAREKVQSSQSKSRSDRPSSKDTGGSGSDRLGSKSASQSQNLEGSGDDLSLQNSQSMSLTLNPYESEDNLEDSRQMDLSSSSEEERPKPKKGGEEDEHLPTFLQEERRKLYRDAQAIGYKRYQVARALRDGVPSSTMDVLIDNMLYAGYGKLPTFREAALAAMSEDAPLPWNPFSVMTENKKKIEQLDNELEDYNAQLLALANPPKKVERLDILSTSGVFDCNRSRITPGPPRPPLPQGDPAVITESLGDRSRSGGLGSSSLSRKATGELSAANQPRRPEDDYYDDPSGSTARQVEEAARRLRMHLSRTKSREGLDSEYPPIEEGDERLHAEEEKPKEEKPPALQRGTSQLSPAQIQPSGRGSSKVLSSGASSSFKSSKEALLE